MRKRKRQSRREPIFPHPPSQCEGRAAKAANQTTAVPRAGEQRSPSPAWLKAPPKACPGATSAARPSTVITLCFIRKERPGRGQGLPPAGAGPTEPGAAVGPPGASSGAAPGPADAPAAGTPPRPQHTPHRDSSEAAAARFFFFFSFPFKSLPLFLPGPPSPAARSRPGLCPPPAPQAAPPQPSPHLTPPPPALTLLEFGLGVLLGRHL